MYKAEAKDSQEIFKSHSIYEVAIHIIENPHIPYQLYIGLKPYQKHEFLKRFLQETKDYSMHGKLSVSLNPKLTIIDYARR